MDRYTEDLIDYLSEFVTGNRLKLFNRVLEGRTRYITVLLEDIYQSQNASAVLRTCDGTGIQDVHVVEEGNEYEINPDVSLGSDRWLSLYFYRSGANLSHEQYNRKPSREGGDQITLAINSLKKQGYRIVATSPHKGGSTPESFDLEKGKAVLMFGTELSGLTDRAMNLADESMRIPMEGFTESYNISVSAAVILYVLRKRLENTRIDWRISEEEQKSILLNWLRKSIKMSEQIESKYRREYGSTF